MHAGDAKNLKIIKLGKPFFPLIQLLVLAVFSNFFTYNKVTTLNWLIWNCFLFNIQWNYANRQLIKQSCKNLNTCNMIVLTWFLKMKKIERDFILWSMAWLVFSNIFSQSWNKFCFANYFDFVHRTELLFQ